MLGATRSYWPLLLRLNSGCGMQIDRDCGVPGGSRNVVGWTMSPRNDWIIKGWRQEGRNFFVMTVQRLRECAIVNPIMPCHTRLSVVQETLVTGAPQVLDGSFGSRP